MDALFVGGLERRWIDKNQKRGDRISRIVNREAC